MSHSGVSLAALQRLPTYLNYLKSLNGGSVEYISATTLASALDFGEVQVRKDLAAVSEDGKPKVGYPVTKLIYSIEEYLGYMQSNDAVIVGAGNLGRALLEYSGFKNYGLNILAAFDVDESLAGDTHTGKKILSLNKFDSFCREYNIRIGIITVPERAAQEICDMMVANKIEAIWNFAPTHLVVPSQVLVKNENMASSLAILSKHLKQKMSEIE